MNFKPRHFLRMARWAKRPPSERRVKLVLRIIAAALVSVALERLFGTPAWMQLGDVPRGRISR